MRFLNIDIPQGATILNAKITFICRSADSLTEVNTKIQAAAEDNPGNPSSAEDYLTRPKTEATVNWDNIPPWEAEATYDSPDIKQVIQEVINRPTWEPGNALLIFWHDLDDRSTHNTGTERVPYSYNGKPIKAAILTVEYSIAPPVVGRSYGYITA
ncbi:unnamed protein product [marine sediment metagenome]|uniref:Uncharacterized protein n=1 Tax=marine sediment metagenome TaxID=412755 RepID=X1L8F0_9ZZZZ